eukprot:1161263-Pelagomonas_calceolata.AAC.23
MQAMAEQACTCTHEGVPAIQGSPTGIAFSASSHTLKCWKYKQRCKQWPSKDAHRLKEFLLISSASVASSTSPGAMNSYHHKG